MDLDHLPSGSALLSIEEMYRADAAAMAQGISGERLMEAAGAAVAEAVARVGGDGPVAVLCGPGNNGGDGFVAARLLAYAGRTVRLALLGDRARLSGDAATHAARWQGPIAPLSPDILDRCTVVVDALFGAGLTRPLEGVAAETVRVAAERDLPVIAVDMPSGVHGDSGAVTGPCVTAAETVTFFRRKPGHLLLPGRAYCGSVTVADIGIPESVLAEIRPRAFANGPALWGADFPRVRGDAHKYSRGHAVLNGGASVTGASRLAAAAALRTGAGLVTIASPPEASVIYRGGWASVIVRDVADLAAFQALIGDARVTAVLLGPGNGVTEETAQRTLAALATSKACVLDADALSVFAERRDDLLAAVGGNSVLTPHEGEYGRLFAHDGAKPERARAAASESGAVVLLKGADTVIASPDGLTVINENAPATLATAGSGDVLAGIILGLLAQGMPVAAGAAAASWLHGDAAQRFGPGLVADDLPDLLPATLRSLQEAEPQSDG